MPRLRYTPRAVRDLRSILQYVTRESGSIDVGSAFVVRLRARCKELAILPGQMGRPRFELLPDLRSFAFRSYIIFFRYRDDVFEIIAIIEGHRDVERHFPHDDG
ncbi:type II toxin-antitoxin system RelE/ParE family toxin [Rhizobium wuzhouense]|uniref:Type II toxin-antitoxin system RelE/ParE family toxin n=1 Tax=Rhizobium wuzhouense TaxID=1986026 RepID=A0ABX5NVG6_9HYPH|nr:type II toxin-antitoxin system RelE/ParE family toxin [Rhizobium wuzhouense]PYB77177.1 type II toxin-antitoxin system RelE/ParE family toxin [Rhizobium wuzhouense]